MKLFLAGFAMLGLLVGYLAGLSSSPISSAVLAAVFSFAGGTVLTYVNASKFDRKLSGAALMAFSSFAAIGLTGGIVIKENKLLTILDRQRQLNALGLAKTEQAYLKSSGFSSVLNAINQKLAAKEITAQEAYDELLKELQSP